MPQQQRDQTARPQARTHSFERVRRERNEMQRGKAQSAPPFFREREVTARAPLPDILLILKSFIICLCNQRPCTKNMLFESSSTSSTSSSEDRRSVESRFSGTGVVLSVIPMSSAAWPPRWKQGWHCEENWWRLHLKRMLKAFPKRSMQLEFLKRNYMSSEDLLYSAKDEDLWVETLLFIN